MWTELLESLRGQELGDYPRHSQDFRRNLDISSYGLRFRCVEVFPLF